MQGAGTVARPLLCTCQGRDAQDRLPPTSAIPSSEPGVGAGEPFPFATRGRGQRHRSPSTSSGQPVPKGAVPSHPTLCLKSPALSISTQDHSAERESFVPRIISNLLQRARIWQCYELRRQVFWVKEVFDYPPCTLLTATPCPTPAGVSLLDEQQTSD